MIIAQEWCNEQRGKGRVIAFKETKKNKRKRKENDETQHNKNKRDKKGEFNIFFGIVLNESLS